MIDYGQGSEIRTPQTNARQRSVEHAHFRNLEDELNRLKVITEAMWEIIREDGGHTETQLLRRMHQIEASDGALDDRKQLPKMTTCPQCGHTVTTRSSSCLYCGQEVGHHGFSA